MEMGHLLEPLVAKIFERKTGYRVYQIKKMFQHPQYPWMLADVDYFVELPDGTTAILEIKTTNYNARDNWWMNGKETVPVYYESQGRHYMAVTDLDRCFFCCLYEHYLELFRQGRRALDEHSPTVTELALSILNRIFQDIDRDCRQCEFEALSPEEQLAELKRAEESRQAWRQYIASLKEMINPSAAQE